MSRGSSDSARPTTGAANSPSGDLAIWKFFGGIAVGVLLTSAYIRSGFKLPGFFKLGQEVSSAAVKVTASESLYHPESTRDQRRRSMAVLVSHEPELLLAVDQELGDVVLNELLRRKAFQLAVRLRMRFTAYDEALNKEGLRAALARRHGDGTDVELKRRMLLADLKRDTFLWHFLNRHFPTKSPHELVDLVLNVPEHGLRTPRESQ